MTAVTARFKDASGHTAKAMLAERRRAEEGLRESEELFAKAFLLSPACVVISRASDRVVIRANEALCHLWGCTPEKVIGKTSGEFANWLTETERLAFARTLEETGECLHHETTLRMADGRLLEFSISSRLTTFKGEACVLTVLADITGRKRSEAAAAHLAAIVQFSDDAIIGKDLNGMVTSWNPGAEKLFGYSAAEMVGSSMMRLIPDDRAGEGFCILERVIRGESVPHFETVRQTRDGRLIDVSITASPIKDAAGKVIGVSKVARDITGGKQAEQARRAAEARYHRLVEQSLVGIYIIQDGQFVYVNPRMAEIFGFSQGELTSAPVIDFILEEDRLLARENIRKRVEGVTESIHYCLRMLRKDGRVIYAEVHGGRSEYNGRPAILGTLLDITERKMAEEKLARERNLLRTLIDSMPDVVFTKDLQGRMGISNPAHVRFAGAATEASLVGKTVFDLYPAEMAEAYHRDDTEVFTSGQPVINREEPCLTRDGIDCWLTTTKVPLRNQAGDITGLVGVSRDITDRKQAEQKIRQLNVALEQRVLERTAQLESVNSELRRSRAELKSLFESLPGLYLVLTPDLAIVAASDAYLKATMTTREGILGRGLFEVFPDNPDDPEATGTSNLRASLERVRRNAAPDTMAIQKYDVRGPDGVFEEHYWSPVNSPVLGADGRIDYIIHRVEEVTEFVRQKSQPAGDSAGLRARMEQMEAEIFQSSQRIQAANQQLEAANKELEAFSYSISHDLRAPLRAVNGFAEIVLEEYSAQLPDEGRRYLERIRKGGCRMGELIDDLLAFSRLSRQPVNRHRVDINELVHTVVEELKPRGDERQIEWRIADLPSCQGDPALLKQVWVNLVSNAIKYSKGRQPAIVEIGCMHENGGSTYFVRDNGAGFDMRYAAKLFGVFQRLHRADEFEGTGVGLAIVQRIVHRHGGRVRVEAEVDRGATFYFTLAEEPAP